MLDNKELKNEELQQVSGGYNTLRNSTAGYWYMLTGKSGRFRYVDEKDGYESAETRDAALDAAVQHAQAIGVTDIKTDKGVW